MFENQNKYQDYLSYSRGRGRRAARDRYGRAVQPVQPQPVGPLQGRGATDRRGVGEPARLGGPELRVR